MLLNELMEMASKEPSTSSKDEDPSEDALASSSTSIQKGTLLDRCNYNCFTPISSFN